MSFSLLFLWVHQSPRQTDEQAYYFLTVISAYLNCYMLCTLPKKFSVLPKKCHENHRSLKYFCRSSTLLMIHNQERHRMRAPNLGNLGMEYQQGAPQVKPNLLLFSTIDTHLVPEFKLKQETFGLILPNSVFRYELNPKQFFQCLIIGNI